MGELRRLCLGLTASLTVRGVVVSLMSANQSGGVAAASDAHCRELDELQFTTGEGPCHDAFRSRRPILTPDLGTEIGRWPGYVSAATDAGVGAIFAFPLYVGAIGFGVLSVFSERAGSLTVDQVSMALTFAEIATDLLLDQSGGSDGRIDPGLESALGHRAEIYQAQGMVKVALDVDLREALARMRAYAFSHDQPLIDLAREIIRDRHRLDRGL
ncbi:GAF and ANTAR domain-containing protein [Microlunatus speluncae]|uniref:GAF and ANTAR domain-containing protein n=1 Tax=Microlunatus speluncae TaxID=2594267 RepID=UPI001375BD74|nr:GAF and ANTAR domain-containing protein [Microlunatus speluncae]